MTPTELSWTQGFVFLFLSSLTPVVAWLCARTRRKRHKRRTEHPERRDALKDIETGTDFGIFPFKGIQREIDTNTTPAINIQIGTNDIGTVPFESIHTTTDDTGTIPFEGIQTTTDDTDTIPSEGIQRGIDDIGTVPIKGIQTRTDDNDGIPFEGEPPFELSATLQSGGYEGRLLSLHGLKPVGDVSKSSPLLEGTSEVNRNQLAELHHMEDELAEVGLEQAESTSKFDRKQEEIERKLDRKRLRQHPSQRTGIFVSSQFSKGPQIGGPSGVTIGKRRIKKN